MSDHGQHVPNGIERHCDVAVIGGSAAGLAAALQLSRQRRSVLVVDSGEPRNAPAAHMHGYLGHEGAPPADFLAVGRAEVRSYGGEVLAGRATEVTRSGDGRFVVRLDSGHSVVARRVLAATGLVDELPAIPGVAEHWGADVIHCPFCHGYEVRDRRLAIIVTSAFGLHPVPLFRQLTPQLTVVLHEPVDASDTLDALRAAGVEVVSARVERLVEDAAGRVCAVELVGGERIEVDGVVVGPRFAPRVEPFATLGLPVADHPSGFGGFVETDATGQTAVPGLYAAGNVTDPSHQVLQAAANGSRVGAMISFSLADEDVQAAVRASAQEADWDHRYGGDQLWSGNPNGTLVREVTGMAPGRALDVGAGEGGDAVWLAEQGWSVTASDVSGRALARIAAAAEQRNVTVSVLHADANGRQPYEAGAYDLVSAFYASIPRTPDGRGIANLLAAVAPGGLLLVVGHDLERMHEMAAAHGMTPAFDPDAYVGVGEVAAFVSGAPEWEVELHETRPRPPGAASASHHVDDVILRVRRRPRD